MTPRDYFQRLLVIIAAPILAQAAGEGLKKPIHPGPETRGKLKGPVPEQVTITEHVYFDFRIDDDTPVDGRVVVAMYGELAPMTTLNFISLARGYRRGSTLLTYNKTIVHRIVPDFIVQMGDVIANGDRGMSIYGEKFIDEEFIMSHSSSGTLSMANSGRDTNNSQFFITLQSARWLDGHHVVFGKVIEGMDIIHRMGDIPHDRNGRPVLKTHIVNCGVENIPAKYSISRKQYETDSKFLSKKELKPLPVEN